MIRSVRHRLFASALTVAALGAVAPLQAAEYELDPGHTFINFDISHLGISTLRGRFNTFSGKMVWDENNPTASSITLDIDPASIDTNHAERDKHLRDSDFLDVETHRTAGFRSTGYEGTE